MDIPLSASQGLAAGQRRQAVDEHVLGDVFLVLSRQEGCQPFALAVLLRGNEGLAPLVPDQLHLGRRRISDREQRHGVCLGHDGQARIAAPRVTRPVGVASDVGRGQRDEVVVGHGVEGARGRMAIVRVQRHAVGAVGVYGEGPAEALPEARGLESLFLRWPSASQALDDWRTNCRTRRSQAANCRKEGKKSAMLRTWEMPTTPPTTFAAALEAMMTDDLGAFEGLVLAALAGFALARSGLGGPGSPADILPGATLPNENKRTIRSQKLSQGVSRNPQSRSSRSRSSVGKIPRDGTRSQRLPCTPHWQATGDYVTRSAPYRHNTIAFSCPRDERENTTEYGLRSMEQSSSIRGDTLAMNATCGQQTLQGALGLATSASCRERASLRFCMCVFGFGASFALIFPMEMQRKNAFLGVGAQKLPLTPWHCDWSELRWATEPHVFAFPARLPHNLQHSLPSFIIFLLASHRDCPTAISIFHAAPPVISHLLVLNWLYKWENGSCPAKAQGSRACAGSRAGCKEDPQGIQGDRQGQEVAKEAVKGKAPKAVKGAAKAAKPAKPVKPVKPAEEVKSADNEDEEKDEPKPAAKEPEPEVEKKEAPKPAATSNGTSAKAKPPTVGDVIALEGFGGEIKTHEGNVTTLKALVDESNGGVVLFTYPKASTPGCKAFPPPLSFAASEPGRC